MILEGLLGSLFGGIFRIAPEILKVFDRKNERKHELAMTEAEMKFAQIRGEIGMRETEAKMTISELDAISSAITEQGQTARAAGKFVAALSALVRPLITYWFTAMYSAVKTVSIWLAVEAGADWREVLIQSWTPEDMAILSLILTFWFVGRVWERNK